ncbi:hypothetical protein RO3G_06145 [Rhizopus delemar RA 99-880]|uniref:MIR domain-containing protein n=1 Tax=Rhizopus delemar (strain RA 99-880 / ATCC MYA-4621 / FGSC 9543 / NRRL 43880) TaxID=246409 RepID=I1BZ10_RHIO9|nr:hypothetical protein RO3G_06145 [Rhizopus delemar RA 99-880]|eukprot:EIE81440.1 hypothetical protein RO3G_06145 [Rhizopus delemar RA 99-880]
MKGLLVVSFIHIRSALRVEAHPLEYVRNGDHIRLEHFSSSRKLHSHDERPQLTNRKEHHEVTAYGDRLTSDIQDYWSLVLLDDKHEHSKDMNMTWKALDQQFRLFHIRGCALISHDAYYDSPGGHGHQEVTCMVSAVVFDRLGSQTTSTDGTINPKATFAETPSKWFFKKTSLRIWYELSGFSVHLLLNSAIQHIIWSAMLGYIGIRLLKMFLEKRQINLPGLSWINTAGNRSCKE